MHVTRLRNVLAAALAAGACDSGGKADKPAPPPPPGPIPTPTPVTVDAAPNIGRPVAFACDQWRQKLQEALAADYLEAFFVEQVVVPVERTDVKPSSGVDWQLGEPCKTAKNAKACKARMAENPCAAGGVARITPCGLWPSRPGSRMLTVEALRLTRGDDVLVAHDAAEVKALLGVIDSPAKAFALSNASGYSGRCSGDWVHETATEFTIASTQFISDCPATYAEVLVAVARDGTITELSRKEVKTGGCAGRRPSGLLGAATRGVSAVGRYFAQIAHLETASIIAFERLRDELCAHRAPAALQRAAMRARADEVRHAAAMTTLANRYGSSVDAVRVRRMPARSLRAFAIDNAREGCVRETWGALEAAHQARAATDPVVRRVYKAIAADEARHAALSWQIATWAEQRLTPREQRAVRSARTRAVRELSHELRERCDSELERVAGLPSRPVTARLLGSLGASLWS